MKYYAVVQPTISDDSWLESYVPAVSALVAKHGGKYLARTLTMEKIEGDADLPSAFIILEWPSKEAFQAFYDDPEYQTHKHARQAGTSGAFTIVAGEDVFAS